MPDELKFVDASEKLTNGAKKYANEGKKKSKLIKLTSKSQKAFKRAVDKRLSNSIANLEDSKKVLAEEYQNTYAELEKNLKQSIEEKKSDVEHLTDNFDYLTQLGVKLVDIDRKLHSLNNRLIINNKKTFNLKAGTFKKIVANLSIIKDSALDKYANKRVVTNAYESSIDEIDKLMSQGRYYTAEQTFKKMNDYGSMSFGTNNSGVMEDIYSNTNATEITVNDDYEQQKTAEDSTVVENGEVDIAKLGTIPSEEVKRKLMEMQKEAIIPVKFEEVDTLSKNDNISSSIEEKNEEKTEINKPNPTNFGIDFTKLIKKSVEETPKVDDSIVKADEGAASETTTETDLESSIENKKLPNLGELASELGIDLQITPLETKVEDVSLIPSQSEEIVTDLDKSSSVDLSEIVIDKLPELDDFETKVKVENQVEKNDTVETSDTLSKEIDGQIGFDSIVTEDVADTKTSETERITLNSIFAGIDEFNEEITKEKESFLSDMDSQVEKAISEIESLTQTAINDNSAIVSEPIVASSEVEDSKEASLLSDASSEVVESVSETTKDNTGVASETIVGSSETEDKEDFIPFNIKSDEANETTVSPVEEELPTKGVIEGKEVALDHELLQKMYDILNYKDQKIAELEAQISFLQQGEYVSEQIEQSTGKKM